MLKDQGESRTRGPRRQPRQRLGDGSTSSIDAESGTKGTYLCSSKKTTLSLQKRSKDEFRDFRLSEVNFALRAPFGGCQVDSKRERGRDDLLS